jgi:hypothetical protein
LQITDINAIIAGADSKMLAVLLWRIRRIHGRHWKTLAQSLADGSESVPTVGERVKETMRRLRAYLNT